MERIPVVAEYRTETGSGPARRLRKQGRIPGVVYGRGTEPLPLTVDAKELSQLLRYAAGGALLVDLTVSGDGGGEPLLCIVKEVQMDPVSRNPLCIDFLSISVTEPITVTVQVIGEGEPIGVEQGGVLQQPLRHVTVSCLPLEIPAELRIDVSGIEIGHALHVGDLAVPEGVTVETDPSEVVFMVSAPTVLEEEEPEEAGEGEEGAEEAAAAEGEEKEADSKPEAEAGD